MYLVYLDEENPACSGKKLQVKICDCLKTLYQHLLNGSSTAVLLISSPRGKTTNSKRMLNINIKMKNNLLLSNYFSRYFFPRSSCGLVYMHATSYSRCQDRIALLLLQAALCPQVLRCVGFSMRTPIFRLSSSWFQSHDRTSSRHVHNNFANNKCSGGSIDPLPVSLSLLL